MDWAYLLSFIIIAGLILYLRIRTNFAYWIGIIGGIAALFLSSLLLVSSLDYAGDFMGAMGYYAMFVTIVLMIWDYLKEMRAKNEPSDPER